MNLKKLRKDPRKLKPLFQCIKRVDVVVAVFLTGKGRSLRYTAAALHVIDRAEKQYGNTLCLWQLVYCALDGPLPKAIKLPDISTLGPRDQDALVNDIITIASGNPCCGQEIRDLCRRTILAAVPESTDREVDA